MKKLKAKIKKILDDELFVQEYEDDGPLIEGIDAVVNEIIKFFIIKKMKPKR